MSMDDLMKIAQDTKKKEFEASAKMAEIKLKLADKIMATLDNSENLTIEEVKVLTGLLNEIKSLK